MAALFAWALFLAATLLFVVQPMAGKTLLPIAGGTPAVWTTCLVFFQAMLLLGYFYADRVSRLRNGSLQLGLHLVVCGLALTAGLLLSPSESLIPDDQDYPIAGLLAYLFMLIGPPFFVLSTTGPLLQRWFARTGHRSAHDPYFLYAASNAGSLLGLLGYPFLVEVIFPLNVQRTGWLIGFAVAIVMVGLCGVFSILGRTFAVELNTVVQPLTRLRFARWVALAALPASLLMSTTTHLTTDIAPMPLLWVVPLGLYLLSYIVVFAHWGKWSRIVLGRAVPMLLLIVAIMLLTHATEPISFVMAISLSALFGSALLCHGELVHDRPHASQLTLFYLAMSLGGVLGGFFNAIVAPVIFSSFGMIEYPLVLVLLALVRPQIGGTLEPLRLRSWDALILLYGAFCLGLMWLVPWGLPKLLPMLDQWFGLELQANSSLRQTLASGLMYGLPSVILFMLVRNPLRFSIGLAMLFFAGNLGGRDAERVLLTERNFFGTLHVKQSRDDKYIKLAHGTTVHGKQRTDEDGPPTPLTYYHPDGPIGTIMGPEPAERKTRTDRVAVVGLGSGALAAYARPGEHWTFYEIDPSVVRIATNPNYFTYLREARGTVDIVLGDARRKLAEEPDGSFDMILLDAFSSDAIPVHLLTAEALELYDRKLKPDGVILFHLSNRYLALAPLVARLADAHDPPYQSWVNNDYAESGDEERSSSEWVAVARNGDDFGGAVVKDPHWTKLKPTPVPLWTDDYSNLLSVWGADSD